MFSQEEWAAFDIDLLKMEHYVAVDKWFWQPRMTKAANAKMELKDRRRKLGASNVAGARTSVGAGGVTSRLPQPTKLPSPAMESMDHKDVLPLPKKLPAPTGMSETQAESAKSEEQQAKDVVADEERRNVVTFWFLPAEYVRTLDEISLPTFSVLRKQGVLQRRKISKGEAFRSGYADRLLAVSHRWEDKDAPDRTGAQARAIQAYLRDNKDVTDVWYDYSSASYGLNPPTFEISHALVCSRSC